MKSSEKPFLMTEFLGSISHDQVLKMWDLDDLLQNSVNVQNDQAAVSNSDSEEMDMDTKPPKSRKGPREKMSRLMMLQVVFLQIYSWMVVFLVAHLFSQSFHCGYIFFSSCMEFWTD